MILYMRKISFGTRFLELEDAHARKHRVLFAEEQSNKNTHRDPAALLDMEDTNFRHKIQDFETKVLLKSLNNRMYVQKSRNENTVAGGLPQISLNFFVSNLFIE